MIEQKIWAVKNHSFIKSFVTVRMCPWIPAQAASIEEQVWVWSIKWKPYLPSATASIPLSCKQYTNTDVRWWKTSILHSASLKWIDFFSLVGGAIVYKCYEINSTGLPIQCKYSRNDSFNGRKSTLPTLDRAHEYKYDFLCVSQ